MPRILFICTGNICRSPAAEAMLKHRLKREGLIGWEVESAGTWAVDGGSASRYVTRLMVEKGLNLTEHRSRGVDRRMIERADLVLVMTQNHAEALSLEFPDQAGKFFLLSEMKDGRRYDIGDPYGGSLTEYQACISELQDLIDAGFDRIRSLAEKHAC